MIIRSLVDTWYHVGDVRQITGLGDRGTAVGMSDAQDRPVHLPGHLSGALDVVGQGRQRVLHRVARFVTPPVQLDDDLRPVGRTPQKPWTRTMLGGVLMIFLPRWTRDC